MIRDFLYWLTGKLPARSIDGEHGEPYLERYFLFRLPGLQAYIHRFVASDPDRGLHDHPWGWSLSLVMVGGYREIRATEVSLNDDLTHSVRSVHRRLLPCGFNFIRGKDFHRVLLDPGQEAWTLFLHGPRKKDWGFMRNGEYRLAGHKTDYRIRPWWREAPSGQELRATRLASLIEDAAAIIDGEALALRMSSTRGPNFDNWIGEDDALDTYKHWKKIVEQLYAAGDHVRRQA